METKIRLEAIHCMQAKQASVFRGKVQRHKPIGLDKSGYRVNIFSYFSMKTYGLGNH